jgi:hypothetical protein
MQSTHSLFIRGAILVLVGFTAVQAGAVNDKQDEVNVLIVVNCDSMECVKSVRSEVRRQHFREKIVVPNRCIYATGSADDLNKLEQLDAVDAVYTETISEEVILAINEPIAQDFMHWWNQNVVQPPSQPQDPDQQTTTKQSKLPPLRPCVREVQRVAPGLLQLIANRDPNSLGLKTVTKSEHPEFLAAAETVLGFLDSLAKGKSELAKGVVHQDAKEVLDGLARDTATLSTKAIDIQQFYCFLKQHTEDRISIYLAKDDGNTIEATGEFELLRVKEQWKIFKIWRTPRPIHGKT